MDTTEENICSLNQNFNRKKRYYVKQPLLRVKSMGTNTEKDVTQLILSFRKC